jgi:serine/threonine protein kinase
MVNFFRKRAGLSPPALAQEADEVRPGARLGGRYLIQRVFEGGMGKVCVVEDLNHRADRGEPVFVLKFPRLLVNEEQETAFRREAALWVSIGQHPAIVPAYWVDVVGSKLCVAAEFIAADAAGRSSLRDHLSGRPKPLRLVARWAFQFMLGMEHALARGLSSHGDVKPENLLIDLSGDLRITDFGLAKATTGDDPTLGGTPAYMPSEQWAGMALDERSDLYAFGLVLCELCYGRHPLRATTIAEMRGEHLRGISALPDHALRPLISKLLKADRSERCSLSEAQAMLREIASLAGITLPKALPSQPCDELSELRARSSIEGVSGGVRSAFEAAMEITRRWPTDASGWTQLGRLYLSVDDLAQAHAATVRSIKLDDTRSAPWNNLGVIWSGLREPDKAVLSFRRALECEPDNTGAMLNMATPLLALGRRQEAIAILRGALELAPDKCSAWVNLAGCLWEDGQKEAALTALRKANVLAPPSMRKTIGVQLSQWTGHC